MKLQVPILLLTLLIILKNSEGRCRKRQAAATSVPAASIAKRVVCYFASWSIYRPDDQKFSADDINPHLCTHVIYAFAKVEKNQKGIVPFDSKVDVALDGYKNFIDLKKRNPELKLMLSAGGSREGSPWFSQIAGDAELRRQFVSNAVRFVREFRFDGLDIAWQWPGIWTGSSSADRANYALMVKEMREAIVKESQESGLQELILSVVTPKYEQEIIRGFDLEEMSKYVDFFNIPGYNYHTATEPSVNHLAPLYTIPEDKGNEDFTLDSTVKAYVNFAVNLEKINVGMPLYGVNFVLADPENTNIGAEADEEGDGPEIGALWYNQICKKVTEDGWTVKHVNKTAMGPYAYKNTQWIAYDDEDSIRRKASYARERGIGGIMFWAIDMDDFRGTCHGRSFPLIKAGLEAFVSSSGLIPKQITTTTIPPPPSTTKASRSMDIIVTLPPVPSMAVEENSESDDDGSFSLPRGLGRVNSQRDVVIQNIKVWVTNYFGKTSSEKTS